MGEKIRREATSTASWVTFTGRIRPFTAMSSRRSDEELKLVRSVLADDPRAWEEFVRTVADVVWTSCSLLCRGDDEAREAFAEVFEALKAEGFRRLRRFDGSGSIPTFVALTVREILAERLMRMFADGLLDEAWNAFERFFKRDIDRVLKRRMPGPAFEETRREAYQEIGLAFVADGCRRIRAYDGTGSFTGFVLQTVDRLAIDHIRRTSSRRRNDDGAEPRPVAVSIDDVGDLPSEGGTPETLLIGEEEERTLEAAAQALRDAAVSLSDAERLYMSVALGGGEPLPAREVARLMGRPVEEVYKLKQRVMGRLKAALEKNPAVKLWRASV